MQAVPCLLLDGSWRAGLTDLHDQLLLLRLESRDPRLEPIDLIANRGHVGRLAQVEQAEARGGSDRHQ